MQNMQLNIILFGQLVDIIGSDKIIIEDVIDTDKLTNKLHQQFPGLNQSKYIIAVDKKIISENTTLSNNSTVALLPPFSGG